MTHAILGDEPFLDHTLSALGVPPLHILRAHNGQEYRFYELTGDLEDALHFRHFERPAIRLRDEIPPAKKSESEGESAQGQIRLHE
jgi:hypothetical protein